MFIGDGVQEPASIQTMPSMVLFGEAYGASEVVFLDVASHTLDLVARLSKGPWEKLNMRHQAAGFK